MSSLRLIDIPRMNRSHSSRFTGSLYAIARAEDLFPSPRKSSTSLDHVTWTMRAPTPRIQTSRSNKRPALSHDTLITRCERYSPLVSPSSKHRRLASLSPRLPTFSLDPEYTTTIQYRRPHPPSAIARPWQNLDPLADALASFRRFPTSSSGLWQLERSRAR